MGRSHGRLPHLPFLQLAVAKHRIDAVCLAVQPQTQRHADGHRKSLPEGSGTDFDSRASTCCRGAPAGGCPGGAASSGLRRGSTRLGQCHIESRRCMSLGEDETVPAVPGRIGRVVAHLVEIEGGDHVDGGQRPAGVTRLRLVQRLDDCDTQLPRLFFQFVQSVLSLKCFLSGLSVSVANASSPVMR